MTQQSTERTADDIYEALDIDPTKARRVAAAGELQAAYVDRELRADAKVDFPTTVELADGTRVSLYQVVCEDQSDNPFADEEYVEWTVTDVRDGEITMKNPPAWSRKQSVDYEEFAEGDFETVSGTDGTPVRGY